jgi:CheY-like chemotaxis protein
MENIPKKAILNILLADDDMDDRYFFGKALAEIPFETAFTTVPNGEQLMQYLNADSTILPDVLFLDLNMPRKNGFESLDEIKSDRKMSTIPIIIYSTSLITSVADLLYQKGAHYYIRKDTSDLVKLLEYVLTLMKNNEYQRPQREEFVINFAQIQNQGSV